MHANVPAALRPNPNRKKLAHCFHFNSVSMKASGGETKEESKAGTCTRIRMDTESKLKANSKRNDNALPVCGLRMNERDAIHARRRTHSFIFPSPVERNVFV